jgi:hypothetical protein
MVYVPEITPAREKLALAAPAVTVPDVAVPIRTAPCLTENVTVPSYTAAVDGLFAVTFAVRFALAPVVPLAFPTVVVVSALLTLSVPAVAAALELKFGLLAAGL